MSAARNARTYWLLVTVLAIAGSAAVYLPDAAPPGVPSDPLPAPRPVLALASLLGLALIYGGLGYVGLRASRALDWPGPWDPAVSRPRRLAIPAVLGAGIGLVFIAADLALAPYNGVGRLPHPPFPLSLLASLTAAIGEELVFRLFLVAGGTWLLGRLADSEGARTGAFWAAALLSAAAFTAAHVPSLQLLLADDGASLSAVLLAQLAVLLGAFSLVAADLLRRYGLLAAVGFHFWLDVVWHVLWGGIQ